MDNLESASSNRRQASGSAKGAWRLWRWTEISFLLAGIALLACYGAARFDSYLNSRAAIKSFETLKESPAIVDPRGPVEELKTDTPDFADWNTKRVGAYKEAVLKRSETLLAVLEIPKIRMTAPVLDGTDGLTLNRGVGRIAGTARPGEPGKIGIAGHRDSFFRGLKDIAPGDALDLRTRDGKDIYVVDRIQIVVPSDMSVLQAEDASALTLVTCYPFYSIGSAPKRFVVTAYFTKHISAGSATSELRLDSQRSLTKETQ